jgi:hypothetical protein
MLVGGNYRFRAGVDQSTGLKRFQAWTPPAGFTFQGHWSRADGMGGMFVAEADNAAAALQATTAFSDLLEFELVPIVDIIEAVPLTAKVIDWIGTVG